MNYQKIYNELCERGKTRKRIDGVIYEKHHILPKSMGGSDRKENLANLTLKEHYIAHRLLVCIHPKVKQMHFALWNMCNVQRAKNNNYDRFKASSRIYEKIRTEYTLNCSGRNSPMFGKVLTEVTKQKIREKNLGKSASPETKKKMSESQKKTKRTMPEQLKEKLRAICTGRKLSEEQRLKISVSLTGRKKSEEEKEKASNSWKEKYKTSVVLQEHIKKMANTPKKRTAESTLKRSNAIKNSIAHIALRESYKIPVLQLTLDDSLVKEWKSIKEIIDAGISAHPLYDCLKGRKISYKNSKWIYKN